MTKVWIITHGTVAIAAISDQAEALMEFNYLAFHSDGYQLWLLDIESVAGEYARDIGDRDVRRESTRG
jgi:hypothetical protein